MNARNVLLLLFGLVLLGCGSTNRLAEYDFNGSTLSIVDAIPARPDVFADDVFFVDPGRPLQAAIRVGSRIVREAESRQLRRRLDSALSMIDVSALIADLTLERTSLTLRSRATDDPYTSDYVLDLRVSEYGIVADSWTAGAEFMINARLLLIDGSTGRRIWEGKLAARDPASGIVIGAGPAANDIITAAVMSSLSVEEIAQALEGLAEFSADRLSARLQRDFHRSRD